MSMGAALARTARGAALFAVVFLAFGVVLDLMAGGGVNWPRRLVSVLVATAIFWPLMAFLDTRRR